MNIQTLTQEQKSEILTVISTCWKEQQEDPKGIKRISKGIYPMTLQEREKLAKDVKEILREKEGDEFIENNWSSIWDFCMDEATTNSAKITVVEYEARYEYK